jgi:hypothetical protein
VIAVVVETTERVLAERRAASEYERGRVNAERVQLALAAGAIIGTWFWDLPTDQFTVDAAFARSFGLDPALGTAAFRWSRSSPRSIPTTARDSSQRSMRS